MKDFFKKIVISILTAEAAILLRRHNPKVIAVAGSVGKTSTKDAIYAAIKNSTYARKSDKSFNSEIGIPLTVLGLPNAFSNPFLWLVNIIEGFFIAVFARDYPEVLVLETGIDRPDDMTSLVKWLKPAMVVLTRLPVVPVHVEYFTSPEAVVAEKMKLVNALSAEGVLIYNHDDPMIEKQLSGVLARKVGFSRYLESEFTAREDRVVYHDDVAVGVEFKLKHLGQLYEIFIKDTVGTQHVYSCIAALAVADELSIPLETAVESLLTLRTPSGRMRIIPGLKSTMLIDDTYNSSPIACEQAIQALNEVKYAKRKIAVLGDMLELGKYSSAEHKRIGGLVAEKVDILLTIGVRSRQIAEGAMVNGMAEENIFQYDDVARAGRELQTMLNLGDVVLVKASQGIRAEKIIEEVMVEPEKAAELLVRQDKFWQQR